VVERGILEQEPHALAERAKLALAGGLELARHLAHRDRLLEVFLPDEREIAERRFGRGRARIVPRLAIEELDEVTREDGLDVAALLARLGAGVEIHVLRVAIRGLLGELEEIVLEPVEHAREGSRHAVAREVAAAGED